MADYCRQCGALLGVGMIYCVNCGSQIAAQVDEQETVIRPPLRRSWWQTSTVMLGGLLVASLALIGYLMMSAAEPVRTTTATPGTQPPPAANAATPAIDVQAAAPAVQTRRAGESPAVQSKRPDPSPTLSRYDRDVIARDQYERRQAQQANMAAANAMRRAALPGYNAAAFPPRPSWAVAMCWDNQWTPTNCNGRGGVRFWLSGRPIPSPKP